MTKVGAGGTARSGHAQTATRTLGGSAAWFFLAFVAAFIAYGSLFPFDFQETAETFVSLLSRRALFGNVADAIDNFLLFLPLGFALRICFPNTRDCLVASLLALLSLGLGLQIAQLYLPSRTASFADIFWNGIGLTTGLLAASLLRNWLSRRPGVAATSDPFALLLVLLWFFYESFPFIPTLDYGLLREHIKTAITPPPFETMRFLQHLIAALLCGIALQRARLFGRGGLTTIALGAVAVLLEILVAYGQLRRETLLGMVFGLLLGWLLARGSNAQLLVTLATAAACAYLLTIFTPYRGQPIDGEFTFTPFSDFLWRNVTRDLPPLAFEALAIGSLTWAGLLKPSPFLRLPSLWIVGVFLSIVALEAVRVLVVGYHGDTTPILIVALLGAFATTRKNPKPVEAAPPSAPPVASRKYRNRDLSYPSWLATGATALILPAIAIYLSARFPGIPYNIRELIPGGFDGILAATALAAILWLMTNSPFLLMSEAALRRLIFFPFFLALQGVLVWALLRLFVPLESMHDIVGAPTLGWPWDWELLLRFLALHQALATQLVGAVLIVSALCRPAHLVGLVYWAVIALLLAWPLHLVIVDWAATDNLTELMRDGGSFLASSLLAAGILFACLGGAALGAAIAVPSRRRRLLVAALVAVPLAAICFLAGLESVLVKYGTVFSAAQFILSPDRERYLPQSALLIRFALAYALVAAAIAILQFRTWRTNAPKTAELEGAIRHEKPGPGGTAHPA